MAQRRIILVSVVFFSLTVLTVQTLPQTRRPSPPKPTDAERLRNMTEEERKKEAEKRRERWRNMTEEEKKKLVEMMRKQWKLELEQRRKEFKKKSAERMRRWELGSEQRKLEREQRRKEWEKKKEEAGGFIYEKFALGATEEQWKLIRAKLEKVRQLREQANSMVGASLTSSSSSGTSSRDSRSRSVPTWKWKIRWKDKAPAELTEAQKIAKELIALVERKNTTPQAFRRKMDALRKARSKEAELERQLSEARRELREILTTRQEAALVLKGWL